MSSDNDNSSDESQSNSHSETIRDGSIIGGELKPPDVADHELIRIIGSGGYGDVWLARNVMGVFRAVKVIYRARFNSNRPYEREFAGIERFEPISRSHESQVNILHVGRGDGCFYYVMELADPVEPVSASDVGFVGGNEIVSSTDTGSRRTHIVPVNPDVYEPRTLRSEFKTKGRLPFDECLEISLALTKALDHLHANGLVHRDIKPANIIFVGGRPKLADIGLVAETDATISYVGTEGYIPPEGPGRPQADVYSLGKTIYEISTGRDRNDFPELPTLLKEESERTGLVELNEVVLRACEERLQERYPSALAMHEDLVQIQAGKSVRRMHHLERQLRVLRRIAAVGVVLLVLFGLFWLQAREGEKRVSIEAAKLSLLQAENRFAEIRLIEGLPWLLQAINQSRHDRSTVERLENIFSSVVEYSPKPVWDLAEGGRWARFSPDGTHLFVDRENRTDIYEFESREEVRQLVHSNRVNRLELSPINDWLVTAVDGKLELDVFNWRTGEKTMQLEGHQYPSWKPYYFEDGTRFISRTRNDQSTNTEEVLIWNMETGALERSYELAAKGGNMDLHPDGSIFAVTLDQPTTNAPNKWLRIYDTGSTNLLREFSFPNRAGTVQFSPDGKWVAFGHDIRIVSTETWEDASPWNIMKPSWIVRFSPDSTQMVVVDDRGNQQLLVLKGKEWTVSRQRQVTEFAIPMWNSSFSANGKLIMAGDEWAGQVHLVDAASSSLNGVTSIMPAQHSISQSTFHPTLPILLSRENSRAKIRFWDYGHALRAPSEVFPPGTNSVVIWNSTSDRLLLGEWMGELTIRSREPSADRTLLSTNLGSSIRLGVFAPSGTRALISGLDGTTNRVPTAVFWSAARGVEPLDLQSTNFMFTAVFSEDESLCAAMFTNSQRSEIAVYRVATGERTLHAEIPHPIGVCNMAFGSDNEWLVVGASTGSLPNLLLGWDLNTGQEPFRQNRGMAVREVYRTPEDNVLVVDGSVISIVDPITGTVLHEHQLARAGKGQISPDRQHYVHLAPDSRLAMLSTEDLTLAGPQMRLGTGAGLAAWSPDGTMLVTAHDQYLRVWSAVSGEPLTAPLLHGTEVSEYMDNFVFPSFIGFTPDSEKIFALGSDGGIREWPVKFPPISREEMERIATLYSGQRIEDASVIVPVPAEELAAMHNTALNETRR